MKWMVCMLGVDLGDVMEFSEKGDNIIYSQEFVCLQTNGFSISDWIMVSSMPKFYSSIPDHWLKMVDVEKDVFYTSVVLVNYELAFWLVVNEINTEDWN